MNLVVYIPSGADTRAYGFGQYVFLLLEAWLRHYPENNVHLLSRHGAIPPRLQGFTQVSGQSLKVPTLARLMQERWLGGKLSKTCRSLDAVLWLPFGLPGWSFSARRVVGSLPFLPVHPPGEEQIKRAAKTTTPITWCTLHAFTQQHWINTPATPVGQPMLLPPLVAYEPIQQSWAMNEAIKTRHASGYEFFLYYGDPQPEDSLIHILKSFSKFKKRHHTNLHLVLLLTEPIPESLSVKMATYAYRHAVTLLERQPAAERQRMLAACYALVAGNGYDPWCRPVLEAMAQGTACLVPRSSNEAGLLGEACMTYHDVDSLFAAMSRIFTDENARSRMREQTAAAALAFNEENAAQALQQLFG